MSKNNRQARWFFPTNTNNVRMILAQGLITSPRGFSKYYQDILEDFDGFLPLFKNNVPKKHIDQACSEQTHLTPCLLELELNGILGQVWVRKKNEDEYAQAPLDTNTIAGTDDIDMILVPLPLPINYIKKVVLQTKPEIKVFQKDVEARSNIFLMNLKLQSTVADSKLFQETKNIASQLGLDEPVEPKIDKLSHLTLPKQPDYPLIYAYGGMLAILFYASKNGAESDESFQMFTQKDATLNGDLKDPLLKILNIVHYYFYHGVDASKLDVKMINGIIDCCLEPTNFKDSMIAFLENESWGNEWVKRRRELVQKLQSYATSNSAPVSECFSEAKTNTEKLLLMLFIREDSASFIDYKNDKITMKEDEYILFFLFFGMRDGFSKTPAMIRKYQGLQAYISYKMADYAHQKMNSGISFKTMQPPTTVWQFVDKNISKQTVKELKIQSCVKTVMPKVDFTHKNGKNVYDGYVEAKYEIDTTKYFKKISTTVIDDTTYNKLK